MHLQEFRDLDPNQQIDALADGAGWITERPGDTRSSLYFVMDGFYVELLFLHQPDPRLLVIAFTEKDPQFDGLLAALPVDPAQLLHDAA